MPKENAIGPTEGYSAEVKRHRILRLLRFSLVPHESACSHVFSLLSHPLNQPPSATVVLLLVLIRLLLAAFKRFSSSGPSNLPLGRPEASLSPPDFVMADSPFSPRRSDYSSYPTPSYQLGNDADDELDYEGDHKEPSYYKKMMYHSELFFGEQDSENTSEGSSSGRNSPAPSVYSYHSSIDGSVLLRDLHGRVLNSTSEVGRVRPEAGCLVGQRN